MTPESFNYKLSVDKTTKEKNLNEVLHIVQQIIELDDHRQQTFREELQPSSDTSFDQTRQIINSQYKLLNELDELLAVEQEHLDLLAERTDFLTTDQATRHRDQLISKLESHIEALRQFHNEMIAVLAGVKTNLEKLETEDQSLDLIDNEEHLCRAREALKKHNIEVEGIDTNFRILSTYLQ